MNTIQLDPSDIQSYIDNILEKHGEYAIPDAENNTEKEYYLVTVQDKFGVLTTRAAKNYTEAKKVARDFAKTIAENPAYTEQGRVVIYEPFFQVTAVEVSQFSFDEQPVFPDYS